MTCSSCERRKKADLIFINLFALAWIAVGVYDVWHGKTDTVSVGFASGFVGVYVLGFAVWLATRVHGWRTARKSESTSP